MSISLIGRALELRGPIVAIACDVPPVLAHEVTFNRDYELRVESLNDLELKKPFCVLLRIERGDTITQWMHLFRQFIGHQSFFVSLVGEVVLEGCRFRAVARSNSIDSAITLHLKAL